MDEPSLNKEIISEIEKIDIKAKYLKYMILCLDRKQVAESISKIIKSEKSRNQVLYEVEFEHSMNVPNKILTEKEMVSLNDLR